MPENTREIAQSAGKNLTQVVAGQLKRRILEGGLRAGEKLPTEKQLTQEFGVSRTVIREAISGLKQDGLVASRQGSGVFVFDPPQNTETLTFLSQNPRTIANVIEALELRASVEIGAAELAAQRCSPAQEAKIFTCFQKFKECVSKGEISEDADFAFHVAIAEAANNPRFSEFLTLLGRNTIPRSELRKKAGLTTDPEVERQILQEHLALLDAITARDSQAAGAAMRAHLIKGAERYRAIARIAQMS